jgi:tetratricopeptide (TPR) repeat protein
MNLKPGIVVRSYHYAIADRHRNRSARLFHRRPWSRKFVRIFAGGVLSTAMRGRRMVSKLNTASLGLLAVLAMGVVIRAPEAAAAVLDKQSTADAKKATQLYKTGNYEDAAKIFLQLSIDNPTMPVFVRNLGACYYYLRRPEPAVSNLREYLHKKKDIAPDDRAEVEGWISEMTLLRQRGSTPTQVASPAPFPAPAPAPVAAPLPQAAPAATPAVPPAYGAPAAPTQALAAAPTTAPAPEMGSPYVRTQVPPPAESGSQDGRRLLVWVLGGVGVVGLVTGGIFTYLASSNFSDVEKKYNPGKYDDGKTYAILQVVGYSLGGAAIATAAILWATGGDSHSSVVLAPAVGPGLTGAALSGTF